MRTVVFACTTLLEYVAAAQREAETEYEVIELDRLYHRDPKEMREHVLAALAALPENVGTVLIAMGFCGGSWEDITSEKRLVLPRVDDCVTMMLTTTDAYHGNLKQAGHMYLLGEGENTFSVRSVREDIFARYPEKRAQRIFDVWFKNYYRLDIVETGYYDARGEEYVRRAKSDAELIHSELCWVPGSNRILEKLLRGDWDSQFLVAEPGTRITQTGVFYE